MALAKLIDDATWQLSFMTVERKNWLPGARVLLPVRLIGEINWFDKRINIGCNRATVNSSRLKDPQMTIRRSFKEQSQQYFGPTLLDADELQKLKIDQ